MGLDFTVNDAPAALVAELQAVYRKHCKGSNPYSLPQGRSQDTASLWGQVKELDSKKATHASPVFKEHLNAPLQLKFIKRGGYDSMDEFVGHIVPLMLQYAYDQGSWSPAKVIA